MPRDPVLGVWPRPLLRAGRSAPRGASWLPQAAEFGKLLVPGPGLTPLGAALSRWRAGEDTQVRGGCCSNCAVCHGEKKKGIEANKYIFAFSQVESSALFFHGAFHSSFLKPWDFCKGDTCKPLCHRPVSLWYLMSPLGGLEGWWDPGTLCEASREG